MKNRTFIKEYFQKQGVPAYRINQLFEAIYQKGLIDYEQIKVLPNDLRQEMSKNIPILSITPLKIQSSRDGKTEKVLFELQSKDRIEAVLMRFRDGRNSICISCQAGCSMGCVFCATGKLKLTHNLNAEEITDQVLYFLAKLKAEQEMVTNIVFMGMGEPFNNYLEVMEAIKIFTSTEYFNFSARRITVSTCGLVDGIKKISDEGIPVNLAISLHAPNQELRAKIMPIAKAFTLSALLQSIDEYIQKTHRRVSFEYILLKGINDSDKDAIQLSKICNNKMIHVNLIPYNHIGLEGISGSDKKTVISFKNVLQKNGVNATVRITMGEDISAACGQLANKK